MFVVAVVALARSVEEEALALGADLGVTTYEAALLLRAIAPSVVLRAPDRARALDLLSRLRARGHDVVACDVDAVVASADMLEVRSFSFETAAFVALGAERQTREPLDRVAYADLVAIVRAIHAHVVETVEKTRERQLSVGRAALTGGLLMTKTKTTERTRTSSEREAVVYLFRRGGPPWLVRASRARYDGLEAPLLPSQHENFAALVARLRERAPGAAYDERLSRAPRAPEAADLAAHLVALSLTR
jgi:hypothetical protein